MTTRVAFRVLSTDYKKVNIVYLEIECMRVRKWAILRLIRKLIEIEIVFWSSSLFIGIVDWLHFQLDCKNIISCLAMHRVINCANRHLLLSWWHLFCLYFSFFFFEIHDQRPLLLLLFFYLSHTMRNCILEAKHRICWPNQRNTRQD